ncbi:MAG: hypothetical protein KDB23_08730 [Planctomycetales bacterium]|nr:hypothetical protein [Planctomycetales bacterium]
MSTDHSTTSSSAATATSPVLSRLWTRPWDRRIPRQQLMLDQSVQGGLIGRVTSYWLCCLGSVIISSLCWSIWTEGSTADPWTVIGRLLPGLLGSLMVLPLVLADILRFSNRFVGPIFNLRNALKRIQLGDDVPPLEPRRNDFWGDLTWRVNQLIMRDSSNTRP